MPIFAANKSCEWLNESLIKANTLIPEWINECEQIILQSFDDSLQFHFFHNCSIFIFYSVAWNVAHRFEDYVHSK